MPAAGRTIAVIDVGSNSVRLLVARGLSASAFEVIDEERFDAKLGAGQADGALTPESIERGLQAMAIMTAVARSHRPDRIVAVGTEALRRAPNAGEFLAEVERRYGIAVQVLTGREEGFSAFLGVVNSTLLEDGYLLDIGGGSLELMRVQSRALVEAQSVPLGAIYATERYLKSDPPAGRELRALRKAVARELSVEAGRGALWGTGGAMRNLARIARIRSGYPLRRLHGFALSRSEVRTLARLLTRAGTDERRRIPGVGANRVETLHAAATVINEVMELSGAESLTVSGQGLREGLVWRELRGESPLITDVRAASVAGFARANGVDLRLAERVAAVSAAIFDALQQVHELGRPERELLCVAARLSGVGMHIDYYQRDRHAEYLVHSGDLHGFDHREVVLLAALVRHALSGAPDLSPYRALVRPTDTRTATLLAAQLGLARAIYRRNPSPVRDAGARHKDGLHLQLRGDDDLEPELFEIERQRKRFEAALNVSLVVERQPGE